MDHCCADFFAFPVCLKGHNNCWPFVCPSPFWHSSCCLTKEVKDLGLSEPLSRAWNWAADLLTAQNCVIVDSAQLAWDATCWVICTSQVHFKALHCFHLLYSFVKQTLMQFLQWVILAVYLSSLSGGWTLGANHCSSSIYMFACCMVGWPYQ